MLNANSLVNVQKKLFSRALLTLQEKKMDVTLQIKTSGTQYFEVTVPLDLTLGFYSFLLYLTFFRRI